MIIIIILVIIVMIILIQRSFKERFLDLLLNKLALQGGTYSAVPCILYSIRRTYWFMKLSKPAVTATFY